MKRNLMLSLLLILLAIPSVAQVFYKVEGKDLPKPSYVFGTHHLAPISYLERFNSLEDAMRATEAVVGEIDMTQDQMQMAMAMQPYMMAPSDSVLSKLYTPEEMAVLNEKFKPFSPMPGVDLSAFNNMRPSVLTTMVSLAEIQKTMPGFDPTAQLDASFQKIYNEQGKKIIPLETAAEQAKLVYTFTPISVQAETLKEMLLDTTGKLQQQTARLNDAYMKQDLEAMLRLSNEEEDDSGFMRALTSERNHNWMTRLPAIMKEQPVLVVVGALHLPGPEGLLHLLLQEGYTVTPVDSPAVN